MKELLARGANVVTSQDDVNDPYYPFGKPDPLECASMMAHVAQLTLPHELEQVDRHDHGQRAPRRPGSTTTASRPAAAPIWSSSARHRCTRRCALQPPRRHVIKDGREVARSAR